ncbi:MAG: capsid assembly protein, partial [Bacteroidaceae bacterium]|nr:capsid assembly protein [Bacteroidaceae bacterium]
MSEEKKYSLDEVEDLMSREGEEHNFFSFPNLFATFILNWQWFLLTVFICLCGAFIYLRYATPQYRVTARMLIKDEDKKRGGDVLSNMQDIGFMTNSAGIENEIEILNSRML